MVTWHWSLQKACHLVTVCYHERWKNFIWAHLSQLSGIAVKLFSLFSELKNVTSASWFDFKSAFIVQGICNPLILPFGCQLEWFLNLHIEVQQQSLQSQSIFSVNQIKDWSSCIPRAVPLLVEIEVGSYTKSNQSISYLNIVVNSCTEGWQYKFAETWSKTMVQGFWR